MKKATMIISGGMDSTTLAYFLRAQGYELSMLSFNYGQRHSRELECAKKIAANLRAEHTIIDLQAIRPLIKGSSLTDETVDTPHGHYAADNMKLTVVPNRNAIMLSIAWGIACVNGSELLAFGAHAGDHFIYPDCRPEFVSAMNIAMRSGTEGFRNDALTIAAPFLDMTKTQIAEIGGELGVPYEDTYTCYEGKENHCGKCGACQERKEAFRDSGVFDPTVYDA